MNQETETKQAVVDEGAAFIAERRYDALLAVSAHAAAILQRERLLSGHKKITRNMAAKVAQTDPDAPDLILSLAQIATTEDFHKLGHLAVKHWQGARKELEIRKPSPEGNDDAQ